MFYWKYVGIWAKCENKFADQAKITASIRAKTKDGACPSSVVAIIRGDIYVLRFLDLIDHEILSRHTVAVSGLGCKCAAMTDRLYSGPRCHHGEIIHVGTPECTHADPLHITAVTEGNDHEIDVPVLTDKSRFHASDDSDLVALRLAFFGQAYAFSYEGLDRSVFRERNQSAIFVSSLLCARNVTLNNDRYSKRKCIDLRFQILIKYRQPRVIRIRPVSFFCRHSYGDRHLSRAFLLPDDHTAEPHHVLIWFLFFHYDICHFAAPFGMSLC